MLVSCNPLPTPLHDTLWSHQLEYLHLDLFLMTPNVPISPVFGSEGQSEIPTVY